MTTEEKQLLFKDLCARVPYGVKINVRNNYTLTMEDIELTPYHIVTASYEIEYLGLRPYLRPMSSMTEEEKAEFLNLIFDKDAKYFYIDEEGLIDGKTSNLMDEGLNYPAFCPVNIVIYTDWLNSHHFDYRGLIEKGLALEAEEGMYKTE